MPEEGGQPTTPVVESQTPEVMDLDSSYAAALGESQGSPTDTTPESKPETTAPSVPAGQAADPEHVAWAKRVEGMYDAASNSLNADRLAKGYYELNRAFQQTAQERANLLQALQHPEVLNLLQRLSGRGGPTPPPQPTAPTNGSAPAAEEDPAREYDRYVRQRAQEEATRLIQEQLGPMLVPLAQNNQVMYQQYLVQRAQNTVNQLREEFGKAEDGTFVYDGVAQEVNNHLNQLAGQYGMSYAQLFQQLEVLDRQRPGTLYSVFQGAVRQAMYPRLVQSSQQLKQQVPQVDAKRRAAGTPKGTPAKDVRRAESVEDFDDAYRAAKEELANQ